MFPAFNRKTDKLVRVQVSVRKSTSSGATLQGSLENETDADGGQRISSLFSSSAGTEVIGSFTYTKYNLDCELKWSHRLSYRLGFSNVYDIGAIRLYKNSTSATPETQSTGPTYLYTTSPQWNFHCGINLDSSNRNITASLTDAAYPK